MVDEKKNEENHDTDDEHSGLLGSISKAVAEAEDLLSSINIKDGEQDDDDDDSSQTGDESVLSYYGYEEDDELSLAEELENLDDLEKDLASKLRKAEAHAIQRAEKAHAPQVVRPHGEGKGRRARARNARERREREARENALKAGGGGEQCQIDQVPTQRLSTSGVANGDAGSVASYTSRGTKGEVRAPFEGKGRRARARRARERRESQGCESSEAADGKVVRGSQGPTSNVTSPEPKKLNPAAPPVSPPFEGKGRRARARKARERWANSQYEASPQQQYDANTQYDNGYHYDHNYHGSVPINGEIHYYQHHQCA